MVLNSLKTSSLASDMRPLCQCGFHTTLSRSRLGMMGDPCRVRVLQEVVKKHIKADSVCLCLGDSGLLAIMAAIAGAKKVFVLETNSMYRRITQSLIQHNQLSDHIVVVATAEQLVSGKHLTDTKIDVVLSEPYFSSALLPWHNICLWYAVQELSPHLVSPYVILPSSMVVWAVPMEFDHLWKIRAPVGMCEGFDLSLFDQLVENSSDISDSNIEPQPLWEYPGTALAKPSALVHLHYENIEGEMVNTTTSITMEMTGLLNGIALWSDFHLGNGNSESSGPVESVTVGETVAWDRYTRQGVHLLKTPKTLQKGQIITIQTVFKPRSGEIHFTFSSECA